MNTKLISVLTATLALITFAADAQTEKQTPTGNSRKEFKTSVGTFTLESLDIRGKEDASTYSEKTITTTDGGTATYLVNPDSYRDEAEERPAAAAVASTEEQVTAYPNPSEGKFTLVSRNSGTQIEITNVLGQKIYSALVPLPSGGPGWVLDISSQPRGMYILTVLCSEIPHERQAAKHYHPC